MSEILDPIAVGLLVLVALACAVHSALSRNGDGGLRLRVIPLTHAMLDPGFAYWFAEDEATDV